MLTPLALECCRAKPNPEVLRRMASESLDWQAFEASAARHKVESLIFWSLERAGAGPVDVRRRLRIAFDRQTKRNLYFAAGLMRALALLREAGVAAVPFKGPAVAWTLYEVPGLRPMSDLDLLIPEADARRSIEALLSGGYQRLFSEADYRLYAHKGELQFVDPDGRIAIDLHWRLASDYLGGLDASAFLSRLRRAAISGEMVDVFGLEDLLLFLCVHGGKHGWPSLLLVCDLARLIAAGGLDWNAVESRAREARVSRFVSLGILLAVDLLEAEVPPDVRERIAADSQVVRLQKDIQARLLSGRFPTPSESLKDEFRLVGPLDRLRMGAHYLRPNPSDWDSLPMPAFLFPVYYLTRPFRLAWNWGARRAGRAPGSG